MPKLMLWSALFGGLTYCGLLLVAPKYQSQAEMAIVAKGAASALTDPKSSGGSDTLAVKMDKEAVNTHVRALQSADLLIKIAGELKLRDKREFNGAMGAVDLFDTLTRTIGVGGPRAGESERDRVMNALSQRLAVYAAKDTRSISIHATSIEPDLAAAIANGLAETYRKSLATAVTREVDDQQAVLQGKITKLAPELAELETKVERFRGEINVFKGGAQNTGLNEQQLSELTAELTKAKAARSEADARANSAREMMKAGSADALPDVQKSPLIQNLVQQRVGIERQISQLSATLLPAHPRMKQLNADLAGLKTQLLGEVSKLVDGLAKEAMVAQRREASITRSLDEIKAKVVDNAPEEAKLRQFEADASAKRTELESLRMQLEANRKRQDTRAQPVEAQIISRAQPASVPVFPKKSQTSGLIAVAVLLFGSFWTVTRALFVGARSGGRTAADQAGDPGRAHTRVEPELAGSRPPEKALMRTAAKAAESIPNAALAIAVAAAKLAARAPENGGHRSLVTGEGPATDGGAEAVALAKALGQQGKLAVLINWNTAGRELASLGSAAEGNGISELLAGRARFDEVVRKIPGARAHFIGCGGAMRDASAIDPDHLNLVLDALDEAYDHIIVTGPYEDVRGLFEAIEGRFDAGLLVGDPKTSAGLGPTFLGFEVADIDVMYLEKAPPAGVPSQRGLRGARKPPSNLRAAS